MAVFTPVIPVSAMLKAKDDLSSLPERQTKEQYRKMKELEEARKAGTVPAMIDEEGRDINPHIPQYIAQAPWYLGAQGPTLKHQKEHPERLVTYTSINDERVERGIIEGKRAARYRKGACENCGALTHQKKDCFERPRRIGAKWTGEEIAPDEHLLPKLMHKYDAKRDRWSGYDPNEHKQTIENFEKLEEARRLIRAEKLREGKLDDEDEAKEREDDDEDEDKYAEGADMPGVKVDDSSKTRITVRNLRIREDTAKYLHNLAEDSAYYDPKSRSMRDNPYKDKAPNEVPFGGENFIRYSGEVVDVNQSQLFAWDAHRRGVDVHALAEPTKLEALRKEHGIRKEHFKETHKQKILEQYGGAEHLEAPPKELLLAQSEAYVEYNRKGKLLKGVEKPVIKSRYEEDVYINNHTSVWGSFWKDGKWGYSCCHSFVKNSYCTGEAGKCASDSTVDLLAQNAERLKRQQQKKVAADDSASAAAGEQKFEWTKKKEAVKEKSKKQAGKEHGDGQSESSGSENISESESDEGSSSSGSESDSSSTASSGAQASGDEEKDRQARMAEIAEEIKKKQQKTEKNRKKRQRQKEKFVQRRREEVSRKRKHRTGETSSEDSDSGDEVDAKPNDDLVVKKAKVLNKADELKKALCKVAKEERAGARLMEMDDRKRPYNIHFDAKPVSETEMEAYRMLKVHADDPMAQFINKGGSGSKR